MNPSICRLGKTFCRALSVLGIAVTCVAAVLAVAVTPASALTFVIDQIYSNADGTVQFIVTRDIGSINCDNHEDIWIGAKLTSTGPGPTQTFVFPGNLPTCKTTGHKVLVATEGFAALGLVTPDFVIPNRFVQIPDGSIDLAGGSSVFYTSLPNDGVTAIDGTGKPIPNKATNLAGASASVVPGATPLTVNTVEYRHQEWDHYFTTANPDEISKLDSGVFAGWARTGETFKAYPLDTAGAANVCRFFSTSFAPRSSHFYTPFAAECATVMRNADWQLEGQVFSVALPDDAGNCVAGTQPIYRMYNNGQGGAPNHRYSTSLAIRSSMIAQGWIPEGSGAIGVIACAPN